MALRTGRIMIERIGGGQYAIVGAGDQSQNAGPDYGFPSIAQDFGMRLRHRRQCADSRGTDGSSDCDSCGQTVDVFIAQAVAFLDRCAEDARTAEDPGYFE